MKLNKQKWIQEVRRVEAEIKSLKELMHAPYQVGFMYANLFNLKAEATRLYSLRRVMKKRELQLKSFWHFTQSSLGKYTWAYWKQADAFRAEQIVAMILDGVPGWKEGFLLDEPIETVLVEAVVSQLV